MSIINCASVLSLVTVVIDELKIAEDEGSDQAKTSLNLLSNMLL